MSNVAGASTMGRQCPRCQAGLTHVNVLGRRVDSCWFCGGLWVSAETLEAMSREPAHAAVLAAVKPFGKPSIDTGAVRYLNCPVCREQMNRRNYGEISGVIVDVCGVHGVWLDHDELGRVVEFVQGGGLDRADARRADQRDREREAKDREEFDRFLAASRQHQSAPGMRQATTMSFILDALLEVLWLIRR